ncbi:efflux RND transporter periplasmic adaptor subunit [Helicovermis profundi]|uniref:MacA family efflux pump subunit n=1 Tax=Helicovermis profundi TaxID=3065157 RepID=A0AAU9EN63_9FIRM|nr:MacA family efflux pump subunit [Clostridia bacterium S502]
MLKKYKINKKKLIKYGVFGLIIVLLVVAYLYSNSNKAFKVESEAVGKGDVINYIEASGELITENEIKLKSKVSGFVEKINVKVGSIVKKGDIIALLDSENLKLEIKSINSQIDGVNAELLSVSKSIDKNELSKLDSSIRIAQNNQNNYKEIYDTNKELFEKGVISKTELDASKKRFDASVENLKIAKNNRNIAIKGISKEQREQFESRLSVLEYNLEIKERQLMSSTVKASMDGIITNKFVNEGDMLLSGAPICEISDKNNLQIESYVLVSDAEKINIMDEVAILDTDLDKEFTGKVIKKDPKAISKISDLGINQKRVKITIKPNVSIKRVLGFEFDLKIILKRSKNVIKIKDDAIFKIGNEKYVFLIKDGFSKLTKIETGLEGFDYVEVVSGIKEGNVVILSPENELEDGMKVE